MIIIYSSGFAPVTRFINFKKKAVRIVSRQPFLSHTSPIFRRLEILQIPDIYRVSLLKLYYKYVNGQLPAHLFHILNFPSHRDHHSYETRHRNNLVASHYCHSFYQKSVSYNVIAFINTLDHNIRLLVLIFYFGSKARR